MKSSQNTSCKLRALMLSPHPDDEIVLNGAPGMRLHDEGWDVINVAITLGRENQRERRRIELENACEKLDFKLEVFGWEERDKESYLHEPYMAETIKQYNPTVLIVPHGDDAHDDHEGTNLLLRKTLKHIAWSGVLIETEYWHQIKHPNMLLEVTENDVERLHSALSCHKGEVKRNPKYLSTLRDFLRNNVRLSEKALGFGAEAPAFEYAVLCRVSLVKDGAVIDIPDPRLCWHPTVRANEKLGEKLCKQVMMWLTRVSSVA